MSRNIGSIFHRLQIRGLKAKDKAPILPTPVSTPWFMVMNLWSLRGDTLWKLAMNRMSL